MPLTDAEIQKIAQAVWTVKIRSILDPTKTYTAAQGLDAGWRYSYVGLGKLAAFTDQLAALAKPIVVDAAAVALDIKNRVVTLLGGHS